MIIATVRGFLLNFGVYHATRSALRLPFEVRLRSRGCHGAVERSSHLFPTLRQWSPAITFITCFVTLFATVIAITKARERVLLVCDALLMRACMLLHGAGPA